MQVKCDAPRHLQHTSIADDKPLGRIRPDFASATLHDMPPHVTEINFRMQCPLVAMAMGNDRLSWQCLICVGLRRDDIMERAAFHEVHPRIVVADLTAIDQERFAV